MHLACQDESHALGLVLSSGQVHDSQRFEQVLAQSLQSKHFERVVADKGYESNAIRDHIAAQGKEAVIPSKSNRIDPIPLRKQIYRKRNEVERLINKMKNFRRFSTRYDKLARCYLATTHLVASFITLNKFVNTA